MKQYQNQKPPNEEEMKGWYNQSAQGPDNNFQRSVRDQVQTHGNNREAKLAAYLDAKLGFFITDLKMAGLNVSGNILLASSCDGKTTISVNLQIKRGS